LHTGCIHGKQRDGYGTNLADPAYLERIYRQRITLLSVVDAFLLVFQPSKTLRRMPCRGVNDFRIKDDERAAEQHLVNFPPEIFL